MSTLPTVARRSGASVSSSMTAAWGPSFPILPSTRQGPCTWRKTRRMLMSMFFRFQHSRYQNLVVLVGGVIFLSLFVVTINWLFSSLSGLEEDRREEVLGDGYYDPENGAPPPLLDRHVGAAGSTNSDEQRPSKSIGPSRPRSKRLNPKAEPPETQRPAGKIAAGATEQEAGAEAEAEANAEAAEKEHGSMSNVPPPQHGHRVAAVRDAFLHAWRGYRAFAFGHDEISPTTNGTNDSWGAFGITLVDALDTMYIMGLFDDDSDEDDGSQHSEANEFYRDVKAHVQSIDWARRDYDASFFESSIRYLGGLLSIHQLTGEPLFLAKAEELGDRLLPAFNSPTGIPFSIVNLQTGSARNPAWNGGNSILSELGSVQLEFKQLSQLSGNANYGHASQKVMDHLAAMPTNGLFPVYINPATGAAASDLVSFGGLGDSFYEYLLKQYILSGGQDAQALRLYVSAVDAMKTSLIAVSADGRKFLGEMKGGRLTGGFDHLVCYVPGMLALGTLFIEDRHSDLELAIDLLETCVSLYKDQPTGLGPERVEFNMRSTVDQQPSYTIKSSRYLLRPETVESLFILYRITGNMRYQDIGWEIFQSLERHCKTPAAYSGLRDVTSVGSPQDNSMQSFFLAETLKYLFLLFSDSSVLPLDEYVFTTEAHPFRFRQPAIVKMM